MNKFRDADEPPTRLQTATFEVSNKQKCRSSNLPSPFLDKNKSKHMSQYTYVTYRSINCACSNDILKLC